MEYLRSEISQNLNRKIKKIISFLSKISVSHLNLCRLIEQTLRRLANNLEYVNFDFLNNLDKGFFDLGLLRGRHRHGLKGGGGRGFCDDSTKALVVKA
jgi:hypothetical protein